MFIQTIIRKTRKAARTLLGTFQEHHVNPIRFYHLRKKYRKIYTGNRFAEYPEFITDVWQREVKCDERYFLDKFSIFFLNSWLLKRTMFFDTANDVRDKELSLIEKVYSKKDMKSILKEYSLGRPVLNSLTYTTSGNSIHLLYHLAKFEYQTKKDLSQFETIVEFGGGYGCMARLFQKICPNITYIVIDMPLFSCIQGLYLETIYGSNKINFIYSSEQKIVKNKINIISLNKDVLENIDIPVDLFVSTWGLSETPPLMQSYIKNTCDYFGANHLLLAYQASSESLPHASEIAQLSEKYFQIYHEDIGNNYYLFAQRKD